MNKILRYIKNPRLFLLRILMNNCCKLLSDELYIKLLWRARNMNYPLNLTNPQTFNEKIQWLKLHDRKPIYITMTDKYLVKNYVTELIGEQYVIPLLGVWEKFEDIDFEKLPNQFVLKCTHNSGGIFICRDKSKFNREEAERKLSKALKKNYYWSSREWQYKDIKPRIIAEKYMQDGDNENLNVYKIFNFDGKPAIIQAIQGDKTAKETIDYFDTEWNLLELKQNFPNSEKPLNKPETLGEMLELASKLSKGFPFLRTDFYEINGKVYFSEFTFHSDAGTAKFYPPEWDLKLGKMLILSA